MTDGNVDLSMRPPGKGFEVMFHGSLEAAGTGVVLRGMIDIEEHRQLRILLKLLALIGVLIVPMALGFEVRNLATGARFEWQPVALALGIAAITVYGTVRVAVDIERAAADDARLVAAFLERAFAASRLASPAARPRDKHQR